MATKSISQLNARTQANISDLFEVAYADEQSSTGYGSGKMSAEVIANGIVNSYTYTSAMPNMGNRTIAGAMNTMLEGFAPAYDDTQTYAVGDYCTYAGKMYICSTAVTTAGAWDSTKWTETTCAEEFGTDVEVDSALSTTSENPVQNKVITQNINSINANLVSEKTTAKADIVSISDAQDIPAEDVKADIEPIQDLHGYDYPWVGGAGKNKLIFNLTNIKGWNTNGTWNGNVYTLSNTIIEVLIDSGNNITGFKVDTNGTVSSTFVFWLISTSTDVYANNNYILSGCPSGGSGSTYALRVYRNGNTYAEDTGSGANVSGATGLQFGLVFFSGTTISNKTFYPMLRLATVTDATFAPYSNICPISGYTECEVTRTGVNQWDEQWELGAYGPTTGAPSASTENIRTKNRIEIDSTKTYYFTKPTGSPAYVMYYDTRDNYISAESIANTSSGKIITIPNNTAYIRFYLGSAYGTTYNNDISINYPSTVTSYQAYSGQTYTVSFVDDQDASMTVYSGTLDVTTGVLTVDKAMVDLGDLTWTKDTSNIGQFRTFGTDMPLLPMLIGTLICENYKGVKKLSSGELLNGEISVTNTQTIPVLRICDTTKASLTSEQFTTAMDGVQLLYELATPQVIQLNPTQIDMLLNNNVLSASTGKIQVKYQPANVIGELKKLIYQLTNQ